MLKLPKTLHIEGSRLAIGGTDPTAVPFQKLDGQFLVIEEKVDGAGVCLFFDSDLNIQVWHRGSPAISKEYRLLTKWAENNKEQLFDLLEDRYILFGEWMYNKHTIFYDELPAYFLESDIYDKQNCLWLCTNARRDLLEKHDLHLFSVPVLASLKPPSIDQIITLGNHQSKFQSPDWKANLAIVCKRANLDYEKCLFESDQSNLMEGVYIKHEDDVQVLDRYKFVFYTFVQSIINSGTHLLDRKILANRLSE
jgi:hypothetical protein